MMPPKRLWARRIRSQVATGSKISSNAFNIRRQVFMVDLKLTTLKRMPNLMKWTRDGRLRSLASEGNWHEVAPHALSFLPYLGAFRHHHRSARLLVGRAKAFCARSRPIRSRALRWPLQI